MASDVVQDLIQYAVPDTRLQCAEFCFEVGVNFSKKLKGDPGVKHLSQIMTGLLNTSGGIIKIYSSTKNRPSGNQLDLWQRDLEDALRAYIPHHIFEKCVSLIDYAFPIALCIRKSDILITLKTNLHIRGLARNSQVRDIETIYDVLTRASAKTPTEEPFHDSTSLVYGSRVKTLEGPHVEYKYWDTVTSYEPDVTTLKKNTYKFRFQHDKIQITLMSLPNMVKGGFLIIGVDDNHIIRGQVISEDDTIKVIELIGSLLLRDDDGNLRVWGDGIRPLRRNRDWSIRFQPVIGGPQKERRVIIINFRHFPGGVFERRPESYRISEEGYVISMPVKEWINRLLLKRLQTHYSTARDVTSRTTQTDTESSPTKLSSGTQTERQAEREQGAAVKTTETKVGQLPLKPSISDRIDTNLKDEPPLNVEKNPSPSLDTHEIAQQISWSKHKQDWRSNIKQTRIGLEENAHKLVAESSIFILSTPTTMTPNRDTIALSQRNKETLLKEAIDHIQQSIGSHHDSFGIATSFWASNILSELTFVRPKHHLLDLIVINSETDIELWTIIDKRATDYGAIRKYAFKSGRSTKFFILNHQSTANNHAFIHSIWVENHVYKLGMGELPNILPSQKAIFKDAFKTQNLLLEMKIALAKILLGKDTRIRNIFGRDNSIIMTAEQMETLISLGLDRFNYIEGPPGSGKTYLALHLCQKYENTGYICTTTPFQNFLKHQALENTRIFCIRTEDDLLSHMDQNHFDGLNYLVFDDFHNSTFQRQTWLRFFTCVSGTKQTKLVIFGDSRYQDFIHNTGEGISEIMSSFCRQNNMHMTRKTLTQVHRNTQKVVSFMISNHGNSSKSPDISQISSTRSDEGDDVDVRYFPDIWRDGIENSFIQFVRNLVTPQAVMDNRSCSYEPKDVAILVDTRNPAMDVERLNIMFKRICTLYLTIQDAGTFPVTGLTIDTLANFMGLDREVCILVTSKAAFRSNDLTGSSISNPRYRTFVASRGISRVVFVTTVKIDPDLAQRFNMDGNIAFDMKELLKLDQSMDVHDMCVITVDSQEVIVYIAGSEHSIRFSRLTGETVTFVIDDIGIKTPNRISSTSDCRHIVITGTDGTHHGPWYWTVCSTESGRLKKVHRFKIHDDPWSVCWINNNDIILVLVESSVTGPMGTGWSVKSYSSISGKQLTNFGRGSSDPIRVTANPVTGNIYISDVACVQVFASGGHRLDSIPTLGIKDPWALCVDSKDQTMFVGDYEDSENDDGRQRDLYILNTNARFCQKVKRAPGRIHNLQLHDDKYLLAATSQGLVVYDVASALQVLGKL